MLHFHKKNLRIGLDVDDVCADFLTAYTNYTKGRFSEFSHFFFSYETNHILPTMPDDFWLNLKPMVDGRNLPFLPTCYISSRSFDVKITEQWLEKNGFPCMPVIHTNLMNKVDACKKHKISVFIDDFIRNFEELNYNNIPTLLMDSSHNRQYDVESYRIFNLNEVPKKIIELGI